MLRAALFAAGLVVWHCPCTAQQTVPPGLPSKDDQASIAMSAPFADLAALSPLSAFAQSAAQRGDNRAMISPCDILVGEDRDRQCVPSAYYSQRGAAAFKRNQVAESCAAFDEVIGLAPQYAASMWQRGLSLFYCERMEDGMAQFSLDVTQNPNDTEESIWHYLCNARHRAATVDARQAAAAAQAEMLHVGYEGRPVMRAAMALYTGAGTVEQLLAMAGADSSSCAAATYDMGGCYSHFYSHLCESSVPLPTFTLLTRQLLSTAEPHARPGCASAPLTPKSLTPHPPVLAPVQDLGLWFEANGDLPRAQTHIVAAATSGYRGARTTVDITDGSDYMLHVARVHARRRGWDGAPPATAAPVPTGCGDVTLVTESCGGEAATGHPPAVCTPACSRAFLAWFDACPAAAASPDLVEFHVRCREAQGGSGH